jgi:2-dehydro-3-deoxyphosphogluconate aldolase/(4S)-4-hydroxy-2-oxoglutarate aldolase
MDMVSIPGAMTPTEIQQAHTAGADLVKIFPAAELGVDYFRAVLAPLDHIKVIAVGGIDERNVKAFIEAGAVAVGAGSCIIRKDAIADGEYNEITLHARRMTEMFHK